VAGTVSERIAKIVILAEDQRQVNLVRRYLQHCGHDRRNFRVEPLPSGRGSGEQYVRRNYPLQAAEYRNAAKRRKAALVVIIDADTRAFQQRKSQLESSFRPQRGPDEAIALLIPKRNVETWILCLTGAAVNETTDYKDTPDIDNRISPAAKTLWEWTRPNFVLPPACVDSLREALPELNRIE
jgi:hypothetical protein